MIKVKIKYNFLDVIPYVFQLNSNITVEKELSFLKDN